MLGNHFYNKVVVKVVSSFGTVFNNITITNLYTNSQQRVPIAYGPKSKWLSRITSDPDLEDQQLEIKLPRMSFEITDIAYNNAQKVNRFNKHIAPIQGTEDSKSVTWHSVPYTLSMQLNIMGKNQEDVLQIVEQILPMFHPEYNVRVIDLEGPGKDADLPITLTSVSMSDDYQGDLESNRLIVYTLDFSIKVRFYGEEREQKVIRIVDTYLRDNTIPGETDQKPIDGVRVEVGPNDTPDDYTVTTTYGFTDYNP